MTHRFKLVLLMFTFFMLGCRQAQLIDIEESLTGFERLNDELERGLYGDVNSLLIWHDGEIIFEAYYQGTSETTMTPVYSVTKSVTSAMMGKAVSEDLIQIDDPMLDYFPEFDQIDNLTEQKQNITVADLLTMRSGLAWDEVSATYGSGTNSVTNLTRSGNWLQYILDQPMATSAGGRFTYNSGVTMLLGGVLEAATGQTVETYTAEYLFQPLEINSWRWENTPQGQSNTGWGLSLQPRDMLKFGQLFLQNGEWNDEQIIPQAWIEQSTQPYTEVDDEYNYGYQWWRFSDDNPVVFNLDTNDVYFAWGFGGNFIFVVPHLDLVVVTTAQNFSIGTQIFPILPEYIFPELSR
ncbi:MAG: serine hydrolase [Chloroflexota bacterium]